MMMMEAAAYKDQVFERRLPIMLTGKSADSRSSSNYSMTGKDNSVLPRKEEVDANK